MPQKLVISTEGALRKPQGMSSRPEALYASQKVCHLDRRRFSAAAERPLYLILSVTSGALRGINCVLYTACRRHTRSSSELGP